MKYGLLNYRKLLTSILQKFPFKAEVVLISSSWKSKNTMQKNGNGVSSMMMMMMMMCVTGYEFILQNKQ